ncbi:unnamed protein product [Urochloa humidicola]
MSNGQGDVPGGYFSTSLAVQRTTRRRKTNKWPPVSRRRRPRILLAYSSKALIRGQMLSVPRKRWCRGVDQELLPPGSAAQRGIPLNLGERSICI